MSRKIAFAFLSIALMALLTASVASAEELTDASGRWAYELEDGCAIIVRYLEEPSGDLVIPGELDGLAVTGIGDDAFQHCELLDSVMIPDGVTSIGSGAFFACSNLSDITLPSSLVSIGDGAFLWCECLTSVSLPESIITVGTSAFGCCLALTQIDVAAQNPAYEAIDGVLFDKRKKMLVSFPGEWQGGTMYAIPQGTVRIGDRAFQHCYGLTDVRIPDSMMDIGNYAFLACPELTHITIPASVASIGINPFDQCRLVTINVAENNPFYEDIDGVLFDKQQKILITYPIAREGAYTIPDGVLRIGESAFNQSMWLTSLTIPDSVTNIGDAAFSWCDDLTDITIPKGVTNIGDRAFAVCRGLTSVDIQSNLDNIGDGVFRGCETLTDVVIPNSVTSIGNEAFKGCERLTNMIIPDGVTRIGNMAFMGCDFTSVTIPDSVMSIGLNAFANSGKATDDDNDDVIHGNDALTMIVAADSYAERYAKDNGIAYSLIE